MTTQADLALLEEAEAARAFAYAPYSNFPVGAALLCDDGRIRRAYALLFGRAATDRELRIGRGYLAGAEPGQAPPGDLSRWERYAQALLATNEFAFID